MNGLQVLVVLVYEYVYTYQDELFYVYDRLDLEFYPFVFYLLFHFFFRTFSGFSFSTP